MKFISLFSFFILFSIKVNSQCLNNPSIQAGDINPAPLISGQNGTLSFTYIENGDDYTDDENNPVRILLCLSNIAPADGINSIGGNYSDHFDWQYDPGSNCLLGTQNQDILGGTGGTISLAFLLVNEIACPNNQMGFNANIQPAACMNGFNLLVDDTESSFTCVVTQTCLTIQTHVMLEGPYGNGTMNTTLNELGYLPGQDPVTFFGTVTPPGQPYNVAPWNYAGTEGDSNDSAGGDPKANYATTVVDWVLVSLRTDTSRASTICTSAALLHEDGRVEFPAGAPNCCTNSPEASYFLVVEHRNHLLVMSHEEVVLNNDTITYDFRAQDSYQGLFGVGQKLMSGSGGNYVMLAGNGDQIAGNDGNRIKNIIISDRDYWLNENSYAIPGKVGGDNGDNSSYYFNDFDLNGDVNVQDKNLWLKNNGKFSDVLWEN